MSVVDSLHCSFLQSPWAVLWKASVPPCFSYSCWWESPLYCSTDELLANCESPETDALKGRRLRTLMFLQITGCHQGVSAFTMMPVWQLIWTWKKLLTNTNNSIHYGHTCAALYWIVTLQTSSLTIETVLIVCLSSDSMPAQVCSL